MSYLFSSCPHDNMHDPEKWVALMDYVIDSCSLDLAYERHTDFQQFERNFDRFDFIYAHPLHASQLASRKNFVPLAKFDSTFDEAIIIASKSTSNPNVSQFTEKSVAYVEGTPSHAAYLIAAHRLGWPVPAMPVVKTNYPDVLMAVVQGEADFGIILKSVWDGMSAMKDRVAPVTVTKMKELVHVFMISPKLASCGKKVTESLASLEETDVGQAILHRLACPKIVPFADVDLNELRSSLTVCGFAA